MDIMDDIINAFGLSPKIMEPVTSEDLFMRSMTEGRYEKIYNLRFHLQRELRFHDFVCTKGMNNRREIVEHGQKVYKQLSTMEYARLVLEYAIHAQFEGTLAVSSSQGGKPCDIQKLVDMLCEHEDIKNTINDTFKLR